MKTKRPVGAGNPAPRTTDWRPDLEKEKPERRGVPEPTEDSLPSNGELASALRTIADYLAIEGESTFKILAYQRAAVTFRDHPLSIAAMARDGSLRDIPGVGEAIQAKVAEYLERGTTTYLTEQRARYPGDILALTRLPGIGPKTVKKLWDHLGISSLDELRAAAEGFSKLREIALISERGRAKVVGRTQSGINVDLRLSAPASFGNMLQHLTGSAEHNVALRGYARSLGMSISEYALSEEEGRNEEEGRRQYSYPTEEEVYEHLGMPCIPPELREGQGELEAAQEGRLPRLISRQDLRGDLHVHSDWSDGRAGLEEMVQAARERGLEYICFSDHTQSLSVAGGLTPDRLRRQTARIRELNEQMPDITLLSGTEVDILTKGSLDLPDTVLEELDYVTASIHSGLRSSEAEIMKRLESAMLNPHVDAIGHPTGRLLGRRDPYPVDMERIASLAAETGTFLEINASFERLDLSARHARKAKESGATMAICSDAHSPAGFDLLDYGVGEARRGWLEPGEVANTLPLEELRSILR